MLCCLYFGHWYGWIPPCATATVPVSIGSREHGITMFMTGLGILVGLLLHDLSRTVFKSVMCLCLSCKPNKVCSQWPHHHQTHCSAWTKEPNSSKWNSRKPIVYDNQQVMTKRWAADKALSLQLQLPGQRKKSPLDVLPTDTKQTDKNAPHCYCPHGEIMNTDNLPGHKCLCFPHQLIILHLGTQRTDQIIKNCKWYKHSAQLTYNTCCIDTIISVYIFQQHGCQNLAGGDNGGGYQETTAMLYNLRQDAGTQLHLSVLS